jgi:hypothetical protein
MLNFKALAILRLLDAHDIQERHDGALYGPR